MVSFRIHFAPLLCGLLLLGLLCSPPARAARSCLDVVGERGTTRTLRFAEQSQVSEILQGANGLRRTFAHPGLSAQVRIVGRRVIYSFSHQFGKEIVARELVLELPNHEIAGVDLASLAKEPFEWRTVERDYRETMTAKEELSIQTDWALYEMYRLAGDRGDAKAASALHRRFIQLSYYWNVMQGRTSELLPEKLQPIRFFDRLPLVENNDFRVGQFTTRHGLNSLYIREKPGRSINLEPIQVLTRLLKTGVLARLPEEGIGVGAHIDYANGLSTFVQVIMPWRMKYQLKQCANCRSWDRWLNLPHDILDFVIEVYRKRRKNLTDEELQRTRSISEKMMDRTLLFSQVDGSTSPVKSFFTDEDLRAWGGRIAEAGSMADRFSFQGSMNVVISRGEHEPLPCEEYLNVKLPRPRDGKLLIELGRWAVLRGQPAPISKDMVDLVISAVSNFGDIGAVIVQADPVHARLYRRPGVQTIDPPPGYRGADVFLMMSLEAFKGLNY